MALAIVFALSVLGIIQTPLVVGDDLGAAIRQRVQQRVEQLIQVMAQLLEEMELSPREPSRVPRGAQVFAALQQWQFWALAGGLVLLFWLCWWLWKRSCEPGSSSKHGSSRSLEEEEEGQDPLHMDRFLDEYTSWPLPNRQRICTVVEEVVNDLLCVCRILAGNDFAPRLQPAVGVGGFLEGQSARGEDLVYRLLVPLKPPRGHSFHLELGTEGEMLVRNSRLRVQLECMCTRERRLGDVLCFLHHPEDELMSSQEASLLQTLCTGSYLDVQKTALWLQELMTAACVAVPQAGTCKLTVLPSTRFCKLKLTNASKRSLSIELILAVQQGNSDSFVSME
ncbi:inositol 1,4,5-trisphosphate receptor-interacting protein-like 1 [Gymnogyps californianus]|uniref:inositol 1,4,5-trisphosphate receptor-interacting protein-like 1 n=1 Tax=Gymnogyps californianus TaxID=33616 RepID=UPI0021C7B22D|nr:inositol 1,4,5-trisphosphate receptor-interacting protein-like 1 [Gymnogyps californianus]XP_050753882.1 inositol 1,4,5-trisphosphate receptor-interacting protein-like 1 [Gymnogyps californianus]XP_050753885.1 inositol 1,4,5-trisphosphate receptor-interacting protein-like 1 [Gymnogyps californianus]